MIILQDILRPKYRIEKVACSSRYIRMKRQGSGLLNFVRPTYFSVQLHNTPGKISCAICHYEITRHLIGKNECRQLRLRQALGSSSER